MPYPSDSNVSSSSTCGCTTSCSYSSYPIRYSNGEIREVRPALPIRGYGQDWGHNLSYGNRIDSLYDGCNGCNWFVKEFPQAGKDASGNIAVFGIINDAIWFNKSGGNYIARFFGKETLSEDATNKEFIFTDTRGQVFKFFNYDAAIPTAKQGQFKSVTDPYGNVWTPTYDGNNRVTDFVMGSSPSVGYYYTYYTSGENSGQLQYVTLKQGTTNLRRIEYQFYGSGDSNGASLAG